MKQLPVAGSSPESRATSKSPHFPWRSLLSVSPVQGTLNFMSSGRRAFWPESRPVSCRVWKQIQALKDEQDLILWAREEGAF